MGRLMRGRESPRVEVMDRWILAGKEHKKNATVSGDGDSDRGPLVSGTKKEQHERKELTNAAARGKKK